MNPVAGLPGIDPSWSRSLTVPDRDGVPHRWHVLEVGVSDPVGTLLCVHGNPTWSYLWRRFLVAPPAGWRVVAPDHLGMGFSERLESPRSLAQRVEDLGDLTAALGVTGPVVTVGHDWGGAISLGWALQHRDQLRGVVLGNTAVAQPPGDRGPLLIRLAHVPWIRESACVRTPFFVRATTALSRPALDRGVVSALAAPYRTAARRRSVGDFVADIPFAEGHPSRGTVEAIAEGIRSLDVPALLMWGPRDPVFGEKYLADLRERLPHADVHRFEGASHLVTEDAPEFAAAAVRWVGALDAAPTSPVGIPDVSVSASAPDTLWSPLEARSADLGPAVVEVGGATASWAALAARTRDLAAGLAGAGVRPGDRVALLVEPSTDLTAAVYAVWRAGAVIVVADKGLGLAGMRRALRGASVDHVLAAVPGLAAARAMGLPGTRIAVRPLASGTARALGCRHDLDELARAGRDAPRPVGLGREDECAVVFTSGATGPAKGVVYRHRQVLEQLALLRSTYHVTPEDRLVAAFAPFALLGPALGIGSAVPAIDVTAPASLTASLLADAVAAVDATIVFASPAALRTVVATGGELTAVQRSALTAVRLLMSAGAPVPAALLSSVVELLPLAVAHTPYGMTEALPVTDVTLDELLAAGDGEGVCVGRPLRSVEVGISALSADGRADGPPGSERSRTGEICVRAGHVKDRYDALWVTESDTGRDPGWHRTGDVGHLDDDGRLWVEGRLPHVVTTPTGPLTPVGVEQRVERLPDVRAAAVVGVGPAGTQAVVVTVVPARGTPPRRTSLADPRLTTAVRSAAGVDVAAVLVARALPLDIRHRSKVDRAEVARDAARTLAGRSS